MVSKLRRLTHSVIYSSLVNNMIRIGEKFLEWTDEDPTVEEILRMVTFYWFTSTLPHSLYAYRELMASEHPPMPYFSGKPFGYSRFPLEPCSTPESLAKEVANLTWFREHDKVRYVSLPQIYILLPDTPCACILAPPHSSNSTVIGRPFWSV